MPPPKLKFRQTPGFRRAFRALAGPQQAAARRVFKVFRSDIFDPTLDNHIIQQLSARTGKIVRAVWIERNLRAVYYQEGDTIFALNIGTHDIYR